MAQQPQPVPHQLTITVFDDPLTLDPHRAYESSSRHIVLNVYESLLRYDEVSRSIRPCLASAVPTPCPLDDDKVDYVFPLRTDVRFHDGSLMTPDDVIYSLRRVVATTPELSALWLEALLGERVTEPTVEQILTACQQIHADAHSVTIRLRQPFPPFLTLVAHWSGVIPRRWAIEQGEWDGQLETLPQYALTRNEGKLTTIMNGTGPYRLVMWDREARVVALHRYASYREARPMVEVVRLISEDDRVRRECALMEGSADFAVCQPESMQRLSAAQGITIEELPHEWHVNPLGFITQHLDPRCEAVGEGRFNGAGMSPEALSDKHLRHALTLCFDYQRFINEALNGRVVPHAGPFPFVALPHGPRPTYTYDLDQARHQLAQAWQGEVVQAGMLLLIYTHKGNFAREHAAALLAEGFNQLHPRCRAEVRTLPLTELFPLLFAACCPIAWLGWDGDYNHPYTFAAQLLAKDSLLPRTLGIHLPEVTPLLGEALYAQDHVCEQELYQQMADLAIQDMCYFFVPGKVSYLSYRSRWHGVQLKDGVSNVLDFTSFRFVTTPPSEGKDFSL